MTHPTLYIVHGWTYTITPWNTTIAIMKRNGYSVEMLHVPGLTDPSKKIFTIEDYVKWAEKSLPDNAIVLGHSNGGRILLNLANKNSNKFRHLILLDSAGVYEKSKKRDFFRFLSKIGAPLKKIPLLRKIFHRLSGASDYDHAPENMKQTMKNMLESDRHLSLDNIDVPTTILWGKADTITPSRQAEVLHEKLKNSTLDFYEKWTHAPYISDPAGLAHALESVVNSIEKRKK